MFKVTKRTIVIQRRPLFVISVLLVLILTSLACAVGGTMPEATTPPNAPSGLSASLSAANQITLSWTDNSDNEDGSIVKRKVAGASDPATELGRPETNATSYVDGAVDCGTSYEYFLQAYNSVGTSTQVCVRVDVPEQCDDPAQGVTTGPCAASAEADEPTPTEGEGPTATDAQPSPTETTAPVATTAAPPPAPTKTYTPIPPTNTPAPVCGDGACNGAENASTCGTDCPSACGDSFCTHSENSGNCPGDCPASCGDGVCTAGEDASNCLVDCPASCGDGVCTAGEDPANCPDDCPDVCGDGLCTGDESYDNCGADCVIIFFPTWCGDGTCNGDETWDTCAIDCTIWP